MFQEFAIDGANFQTIFSDQLVCSICIGFLNNIWSIPFRNKLILSMMSDDNGFSYNKNQISNLERSRTNLLVKIPRNACFITLMALLCLKPLFHPKLLILQVVDEHCLHLIDLLVWRFLMKEFGVQVVKHLLPHNQDNRGWLG